MEIEVDLNIVLPPVFLGQVRECLMGIAELIPLNALDKFNLRLVNPSGSNLNIDQGITNYLESIKPIADILALFAGVLRVGVFFSSEEAAAFSVELSKKTIQLLATYQLAIDVTCYPCAE